MSDNPYKNMHPSSLAGGIRKMQMKEIRGMQLEWDWKRLAARREPIKEQVAGWCRCGHFFLVEGDPAVEIEKQHTCPKCGQIV